MTGPTTQSDAQCLTLSPAIPTTDRELHQQTYMARLPLTIPRRYGGIFPPSLGAWIHPRSSVYASCADHSFHLLVVNNLNRGSLNHPNPTARSFVKLKPRAVAEDDRYVVASEPIRVKDRRFFAAVISTVIQMENGATMITRRCMEEAASHSLRR